MTCLHFKVDRRTRVCPDCGVTLSAPEPRPLDPLAQQVLEQAFPVPPPPQEIKAAPLGVPPPPPIEMPEGDDVVEILRKLKAKKAAPAVAPDPNLTRALRSLMEPTPAPAPPAKCSCGATGFPPSKIAGMCEFCDGTVGGNPPSAEEIARQSLAAELKVSVDAATPDWIKTGEFAPTRGITTTPELTPAEIAGLCEPTPEELVHRKAVEDLLGPAEPMEVQIIRPTDEDGVEDPDRLPYPDEPVFSFLGGTAGTGKTYASIKRVEAYDDAKLVATTGIAAVNLGGVTINSLLQYGDTTGLRVNYEVGKLGAILRRLTQSGYYRLIVDEVSMMDGHQLDILVTAIEELNVWLGENGKRLFGMTLVGDFAQLPPINAPFVFQRPAWGRFEPNITLLTEPRRQADHDFIRALQAVRRGDRAAAMAYFGPLIIQGSEAKFDGSTIMATNAEVDRYNKLRMMDITAPAEWFKADRVGEQLKEWEKNIPDTLEMKPGALVMILANRTVEGSMLYANGDLAHFVKKHNEGVAEVTLIRNGMTVLIQSVLKEKGEATGHTGAKLPRENVKGSIRYMPLRVAYATTCHKSQGLSLDRVQIMFHNRFWASPGMLYVALSRARTPQGLRLVGTKEQFEARIVVNPDIRRWL